MPTQIKLGVIPYSYEPLSKTFVVSERDVKFDTTYDILNPKTGVSSRFEFIQSTGPEFDPKTRWIYKTHDKSITLEVCNDPIMVERAATAYLEHKLRN